MKQRLPLLAWTLFAVFLIMLFGAIYVGFNPPDGEPIRWVDAVWAASFAGFPLAGALVVSQLPTRPLGWVLSAGPDLLMLGLVLGESAEAPPGAGLVDAWLEWGGSVAFAAGIGLIMFVPLLLPDGTLLSPRWRWVVRALGVSVGAWVLSAMFKPGRMEIGSGNLNPVGIEPLSGFFEPAETLLGPVSLAAVGLGALSLLLRFRRSQGRERQQLKWLAFGAAVAVGCFLLIALIEALLGDLSDVAVTLIIIVAILALPASIATAVMRHRLYDVDVVINKTLVYGSLTAILAFSYLVLVVALQRLFGELVRGSDLFVAGSTLAVAGLFRPLRGRIQGFIDKRFYRSRYNAAQTLGEFSSRLRDQVDLGSLNSELVGVVGRTMQPAHASIWLREVAE